MFQRQPEQAEQIKEASKDDVKFPFMLHYDANQKEHLLSMLETVGAVVESDDESGHKLAVKANMKQLAFIKKLDSIKRVSSHEGSNPFLTRTVTETATADATVMSMNDDGIVTASVTDECCTPPTIPDGMASAREINVDSPVTSQICCPGAEQWFKVTVPNGGYYTIYTTGSLDTVGALYSNTGSLLREVDDYEPAGKINFRIYYPLITGYTYYVKVTVKNNATGSYQLMIAKKELVDSVQITGANENGVIVLEKGKTYEMPMSQGYTFQVADGETILQAPFGVRINPSNADNKDVYWTFSSGDGIGSVMFDHNPPEGCEPYQRLTATKAGVGCLYAHDRLDHGKVDQCEVVVLTPYETQLKESCGFSDEVIHLILKLYDRVDAVFSSEDTLVRAWKCARLLSEFWYDTLKLGINKWDIVAGSVTKNENRQTYFTDTLGFTVAEYANLSDAIRRNHEDTTTIDFAHMQYALAARLAYTLNKDGLAANLGSGFFTGTFGVYTDEEVSYLGGWLGDAVITGFFGEGETCLKNNDYMSDLDAENIYRLLLQGKSSLEATNEYYSNLSLSNTRADIFLQYIPYTVVREKIFYELIDAEIYGILPGISDVNQIQAYLDLINNEQYHYDTIKDNYPDTYNFLKSLEAHLGSIRNFITETP